mmetsp:Transcript_11417/g.11385  ORF Transcript_11417/g.11385 Transcript_11417/m.11385 type:complete len:212 (-) Transcript_11417:79-714(-)
MNALIQLSCCFQYSPSTWGALPPLNAFWTPQNQIEDYYNQFGLPLPYYSCSTLSGGQNQNEKYDSKSESTTKDFCSTDEAQLAFSKIDAKSQEVNNTRSKTENLDTYIEEIVYKAKDTKRNRVVYKCKFEGCSKKCSKRWNLIDHIKMHLGVKPYECDQCGSRFTQKGNLKKHLKVHLMPSLNQRKVHKCKYCSKSYTERYNLMHHMQTHL